MREVLPYPDPLRRRRARKAARALVRCEPWPEEDATPSDIAQLSLLRVLWLQRETRQAVRWRQQEAAALLVRSAVETCITGLYWLCDEPDVARMRSHNARSFHRLFAPIATGDPISPDLIEEIAATMGSSTSAHLPSLLQMANAVKKTTGHSFAIDLYERLYIPLSMLYAHPTGVALQRHVGRSNRLKSKPARVWTKRSMQHAVDTCMAGLALAIAKRTDAESASLVEYADAHLTRAIAPIATMGGRAVLDGLHWTKLPSALRTFGQLRRYYDSGEAARDSHLVRKARTERAYDEMLQAVGTGAEPYRQMLLDYFAEITSQSANEDAISQ